MNNSSPFILYQTDKSEFINKVCALCLSTLYYPETGDKMVKCCRLQCHHTFHTGCMEQMLSNNHTKCPECREQIDYIINVNRSLELTIRNDAFDHNNIDAELRERFTLTSLQIKDYPYHKIVFERWRNLWRNVSRNAMRNASRNAMRNAMRNARK